MQRSFFLLQADAFLSLSGETAHVHQKVRYCRQAAPPWDLLGDFAFELLNLCAQSFYGRFDG